ncbi:hypothetical protein ACXYL9_08100 [Qipengyuania sp. CAU 1752]
MTIIADSYTALENRLLVAAYYTSNRLDKDTVTLKEISEQFSFEMPVRFTRVALADFGRGGISKETLHSGEMEQQRIWLTAHGIREAERLIETNETDVLEFDRQGPRVPASDRVVSRKDNQREFDRIEEEIRILKEHVYSQDNEIGDKLGDSRELLQQEIDIAQTVVASNSFRVASLLGWIRRALQFVMEKFAGTAVAEAAKRLFDLLEKLL